MLFNKEKIQTAMSHAMEVGRKIIPEGSVATYIPELGKARKDALGLCIQTLDGEVYKCGDTNIRFTIQSVSKVISLCMAIETRGVDTVFAHVGKDPSGEAFNSQ